MMENGKYIDLHCHLDGSITAAIAKKLAGIQNIKIPAETDEGLKKYIESPAECESLNDFLKCFALPNLLMQTKEGLEEAAYLAAENMYSLGAAYAEIRFAPQLHTKKGLTQEEAVQAVLAGIERSQLKANLILCCMRGDKNEKENFETLELTKKHLVEDDGVVAMDLAGAEALFKTENFAGLFAKAREYNIPFTVHAGEADGAESVRSAIAFGPRRIGHGVNAIHDETVMKLIRDKGIFLEMCPTSNRKTHTLPDMSEYPLITFLNYGIRATINTDDMAIAGTDISSEFAYMKQLLGLTPEQEKQIIANSIEAAFTSEKTREELRKVLL